MFMANYRILMMLYMVYALQILLLSLEFHIQQKRCLEKLKHQNNYTLIEHGYELHSANAISIYVRIARYLSNSKCIYIIFAHMHIHTKHFDNYT